MRCKNLDLIGQVVSEHMLGDRQVPTQSRNTRPTANSRQTLHNYGVSPLDSTLDAFIDHECARSYLQGFRNPPRRHRRQSYGIRCSAGAESGKA